MAQQLLVFPKDLRQSTSGRSYPYIAFSYQTNRYVAGDRIFLPMPPGLEISDSMSYNTIDLGIIGDTAVKAIEAANTGEGGFFNSIASGIKAGSIDLKEKITSMNAVVASQIAAKYGQQETLSNLVQFGARQILAPNTNTTFQGSNIRTYSFRFKMVARDRSETDTIKNIVSSFRENMYPEGTDVSLEFPGTWNIRFCDQGPNLSTNRYLPKVYRCFMTGFSSTYNSTNNMWHDDGSPVEVDVSMNFQEVKALKKSDITALNS